MNDMNVNPDDLAQFGFSYVGTFQAIFTTSKAVAAANNNAPIFRFKQPLITTPIPTVPLADFKSVFRFKSMIAGCAAAHVHSTLTRLDDQGEHRHPDPHRRQRQCH